METFRVTGIVSISIFLMFLKTSQGFSQENSLLGVRVSFRNQQSEVGNSKEGGFCND
jgi:hypothetical protein